MYIFTIKSLNFNALNTKKNPEPNIPANPVPELQNPIKDELNDLQYPNIVASPNDYIQPHNVAPINDI